MKLNIGKQEKFIDKINRKVGKTISERRLISENDNILVAISGGKDSLVLLDILSKRLRFTRDKYMLFAAHIKVLGLSYEIDFDKINNFCKERNVDFEIIETKVNLNLSDKTPCFICSHTRRKLLFETAVNKNCQKLALGHHMDDSIETLFMNMIYHSNISAIPSKITMFNGKFEIIRPLIKIRDAETKKYAEIMNFPKLKENCSFEDKTKRDKIRKILQEIESSYPNGISSIYASMKNIDNDYLI